MLSPSTRSQSMAGLAQDFNFEDWQGTGAVALRLPVVVLSNAAGAQERDDCLAAGARACLSKPARLEDLVALLQAQLEHHG